MDDKRVYFYVDSRDTFSIILELNGADFDISTVTKIEITFNGTTYDSTTYADAFNWSTGNTGEIEFMLGTIITSMSSSYGGKIRDKKCELALYYTGYSQPIYWHELIDITAYDVS